MRKRENKQNHRPILRHFTTWLHGAGAKCALIYAVGTLVHPMLRRQDQSGNAF